MWYESVKDNLMKYKCLCCSKEYSNMINEELKKIKNTPTFSNNDIKKFIFLLGKRVYPYKYVDDSEKFKEATLPETEKLYSNLSMEDITEADYKLRKIFSKEFEKNNLSKYHNIYLKSDVLLLANVIENLEKYV